MWTDEHTGCMHTDTHTHTTCVHTPHMHTHILCFLYFILFYKTECSYTSLHGKDSKQQTFPRLYLRLHSF